MLTKSIQVIISAHKFQQLSTVSVNVSVNGGKGYNSINFNYKQYLWLLFKLIFANLLY